jgi:hypothetical protein
MNRDARKAGKMTLVAVHPDSASLGLHMDIGGSGVSKVAGLIKLQKIEVCGAVSDAALERLHGKAKLLVEEP